MEASHVSQHGSPSDPNALLAKLYQKTVPNENTSNKVVNFTTNPDGEKKREKYLTAKYGAHQMALIRKRLKVEMWMFDQLQEICESEVSKVKGIQMSPMLSIFRLTSDSQSSCSWSNIHISTFNLFLIRAIW